MLATQQTLEFVTPLLPENARVLEVGCGAGELAAELVRLGHAVVAIDSDPRAVAVARERGVDARCVDFNDDGAPLDEVDAVLFTRSLHHVHALAPAIDRARSLLAPDGRMIVEDWAWESVDEATASWASRLCDVCVAITGGDRWVAAEQPYAAWHEEHGGGHHELHRGSEMLAAFGEVFERDVLERVPYFYRYVARSDVPHLAAHVLGIETVAIESGAIRALGLRFSGRRPSSRPPSSPA